MSTVAGAALEADSTTATGARGVAWALDERYATA
jgi:hypothetical protein